MKHTLRRLLAAGMALSMVNSAFAYHANPGKAITIDGREYTVIQEENSYGVPVKEVLVAPDFQEISLDIDGDGTLDHWEISNSRITFTASEPYRGNFSIIEVKERSDSGIREVKLALSKSDDKYYVTLARTRPYKSYKSSEKAETVIGSCLANDPSLAAIQKDFREALERISKEDISKRKASVIDMLAGDRPEKIDASCKTGKFKDTTDTLIKGMAEVLVSGTQSGDKGRPTYLKCLESYDLGLHAARIERNFLNIGKPGGPKPYMCGPRAGDSVGDAGGEYFESENAIRFYKSIDSYTSRNASSLTNSSSTAELHYAKVYFHEALHQSGIEDEKLIKDAEGCCAGFPGLTADRAESQIEAACHNLRKTTLDLKTKRIMETMAWESVDGYQQIMGQAEALMGIENIDDFKKKFSEGLYNGRVKAGDQYAECVAKKDKDTDCAEEYATALKNAIETNFIRQCESKVRYLVKRGGQIADKAECTRLGEDLAHAFFAHRLKCGEGKAWFAPMKKADRIGFYLIDLLLGSIRAAAVDFKTCSANDFAQFSQADIKRTEEITTQLGAIDFKDSPVETRRFTIEPRDRSEDRIDRVANAQPIRRDEIFSGPVKSEPIRLGQASQMRQDIASRTNRSTAVLDRAMNILKLPEARAATDEIASYSARLKGRSRSVSANPAALRKSERNPAAIDNFFQEVSELSKPVTVASTKVASLDSAMKTMNIGMNGRTDHTHGSASSEAPTDNHSGTQASGSQSKRVTSSVDQPAGGHKGASVNGSEKASAPAGTAVATGKAVAIGGPVATPQRGGASTNSAVAVKPSNPLRKEFPDHSALEKFLLGEYHKVAVRLKNSNFQKLLIDENFRVVDSRGVGHGSRSPEAVHFVYDHDQGLLVRQAVTP